MDALDGVAGGAHLTVYLETTTERCTVVRGEEAGVVPWEVERVDNIVGKEGDGRCRCCEGSGCCSCGFVAVLA